MNYKEELQKPFKATEIEWRVGATNADKTKGIALPYITNTAIQNRLDDIFGVSGWKNEFKEWKGSSQICGISCKINDEWIMKWDGAPDTKNEAIKGGLSDSMKRSARQWGIGRYLTQVPNQWCKIKAVGTKSYKLAEIPKLPDWALPKISKTQITWEEPHKIEYQISEGVQKCVVAFEKIGVTKIQLENYLNNEAEMFDSANIEELKRVYRLILSGIKTKEDFFFIAENPTRSTQAEELTMALLKESEEK